MLGILSSGKRVINIDETWLSTTSFRRKKWRVKGDNNSVSHKNLSHNVNMIAAVDTEGQVYLSLTMFNTDTNVMLMFLSRLASLLTQENADWRSNTVILLDGAPYHKSEETKAHMIKLGLTVCFTAVACYDSSPIEFFFAWFKKEELNPENLPTGKR